eukprot:scaffold60077_cov58-Attheya_sp.AAC.1
MLANILCMCKPAAMAPVCAQQWAAVGDSNPSKGINMINPHCKWHHSHQTSIQHYSLPPINSGSPQELNIVNSHAAGANSILSDAGAGAMWKASLGKLLQGE